MSRPGGNPNYSHVGTSPGPWVPAPLARHQSNIPPLAQAAKPFAAILLRGLQTRFFSTEDDFLHAKAGFIERHMPYLAFRFDDGLNQYVVEYPERMSQNLAE